MQKECLNCSRSFEVDETDQRFYQKMKVPDPTFCPECRAQRRLAFRNDRSLYRSKSALSGKDIISMYNPDWGFTVYEQKEWYGDGWDPLDYGRDFDFTRPFFGQFAELQKAVPRFNLFNLDTENCDFVNYAPHCKNCYLTFGSWFNEDCMYGQTLNECKNCVDNLFLDRSELCYENIDSHSNYSAKFCQNSSNVTDSYFCFDCQNVQNSIGCWNLRNKSYHILNKPVSKEEFEAEKEKFKSYEYTQAFKKKFDELVANVAIHKAMMGQNNHNVSGNFIFNCKNIKQSFSVYRCEDIAYCARSFDQKDSYDFDGGGKGELLYEGMSNDFSYNSISCTTSEHLSDSHYCDLSFSCKNIFACIGLRQKQYCILNKQYTEAEYRDLLPRIIEHMKKTGEWGEFFPVSLSPFAYNETIAQEYYPISAGEAQQKGYKWLQEEGGQRVEQGAQLPDNIAEANAELLKTAFSCENCGRGYKVTTQELQFYKTQGLPLPHFCPNCRHKFRMSMRTPRKLWDRQCGSCSTGIKTSYSPDRPEIVYCEQCYLKAVY
ncbi:MAG: hypothetical protein OEY44_00440 [Candidatus Peregrinibacteria bacterium]|nr:hypothetical protein [Candidatus Peregrinibacteria bacterium]